MFLIFSKAKLQFKNCICLQIFIWYVLASKFDQIWQKRFLQHFSNLLKIKSRSNLNLWMDKYLKLHLRISFRFLDLFIEFLEYKSNTLIKSLYSINVYAIQDYRNRCSVNRLISDSKR